MKRSVNDRLIALKQRLRNGALPKANLLRITTVIVVAALGLYFLRISHAATVWTGSEAESGTLSGDAGTVPDSNASGSSAVIFGSGIAPTNLQVFTGGNNIALVWDMPAKTVQHIEVWRNNTQIATVTPNSSAPFQNGQLGKEYDDGNVTTGTAYQYKVRADFSDGTVSSFTPDVSATQPTSSQSVPTITVDSTNAPQLASYFTNNIVPLLKTWYPKDADEIAYPSYTAPTHFTINFQSNLGAFCETSNATITCDPSQIATCDGAGQSCAAALVHESTHVIQDGFPNDTTGWATEGGASWDSDFFARQNINDYRPYPGNPNEQGPASYTPGAFFIEYIRETYDSAFPKKLNVAQHNGTYTNSFFTSETGGLSVSQVWQAAIASYNSSTGKVTDGASKCLELQNGTVANGTKIIVDSCSSATKQQWALHFHNTSKTGEFEITSPTLGNPTGTDYCFDDSFSGTADGTNIQFWGCDQTKAQYWRFGSNGSIVNLNSGTCLDTAGGSTVNGAQVIINTCNGSASQNWSTPS